MYASAWIFVIAPIVVSFSTSEPRPITTSSPTTTLSCTHDLEAVAHLAPVPALLHEPHEVRAFEPQRLGVRELGAEGVARAGPPLAVRLGRLFRRLVVHGDLVLELHVVEDRHLVAAHD